MCKNNNLPTNRQTGDVIPKNKRTVQQGNFTMIANEILMDTRLSFKAKGIFSLLLSRPLDWKIHLNEIVSRSDKDGKRAVQSGFKELMKFGYVDLVTVYNEKANRFEGTFYQIPDHWRVSSQPHFRTVCKTDEVPTALTEKEAVSNAVGLKTALHTKTKESNTNCSKTKNQQHQIPVAAVSSKNVNTYSSIMAFFESLQAAKDWQLSFFNQTLSNGSVLSIEGFELLLQHFKENALRTNTQYQNLEEVQKHFTNWFNKNHRQKTLSYYIEQQRVKYQRLQRKALETIKVSNGIFKNLLAQSCKNVRQVLVCLKRLQAQSIFLQSALSYLKDDVETATRILLKDIQQMIERIENGKKLGRLDWFCSRA